MDRKALIREYKESRRPMGIFQVRNTVTGQVLIGASSDLPSMLGLGSRLSCAWARTPTGGCRATGTRSARTRSRSRSLDTLPPQDQPDYDPRDDLRVLETMWLEKLAPFDDRG